MIYASVYIMCILSQTKINFSDFPVNIWLMLFTETTFLQFGVHYNKNNP